MWGLLCTGCRAGGPADGDTLRQARRKRSLMAYTGKARSREVSQNTSKVRVVVADDESIIRMDLREMLDSLGYEVVGEAGDGTAAVSLARELRPDIVIMDIKMPGMDGIAAAKVLTEEHIAPVLLLTAFSQQELIERAKEAGVVGYVVKPFRESDLKPAIDIALARYREFLELERTTASLRETLEARKLIERAKGVLMDTQGLREAEAFQKMQRLSMNTRKSMREIAEAILLAHEVGKEGP
jgi:response regulator NasT